MYIPLNVERTDCETCGPSYDELTVEFGDEGLWEGRLLLGCYGGSNVTGTRAEVIDWLRKEAVDLVDPPDLAKAIGYLENA